MHLQGQFCSTPGNGQVTGLLGTWDAIPLPAGGSYAHVTVAEDQALTRNFDFSNLPLPPYPDLRQLVGSFNYLHGLGKTRTDIVIAWKQAGVEPMTAAIVAGTLWDLKGGKTPPDPNEAPSFKEIVDGYAKDLAGVLPAGFGGALMPIAIIVTALVLYKVLR